VGRQTLNDLLDYDWFKEQVDSEDIELFESNFKSSTRTQLALRMYLEHEMKKLDAELSLTKLREIPDRAEYALMVAAQKDVLQGILNLLVEE